MNSKNIDKTNIAVAGKGLLILDGSGHRVTINARSIDGVPPKLIEVKGDLAMMETAMMRTTVLVEMFGKQFRVRVAGYRKDVRALLLMAAPFFRLIWDGSRVRHSPHVR